MINQVFLVFFNFCLLYHEFHVKKYKLLYIYSNKLARKSSIDINYIKKVTCTPNNNNSSTFSSSSCLSKPR